jgi:SAM-dependent methyltransferase
MDWPRFQANMQAARDHAAAGSELPPMTRQRGLKRLLARTVGKGVLRLARVFTASQWAFNQAVLDSLQRLADGHHGQGQCLTGHESCLQALGSRCHQLEQAMARLQQAARPSSSAASPEEAAVPLHDVNHFLHALRSRELRRMPPGAETFLSAGCAGSWYFKWIAENYPTPIRRHLGIEYYSPKPPDLPPGVEWISNTLGDMADVKTEEVDLVFAGQAIEHVWPEDVIGFLSESHRVLKPGGWLVMDSPNRRITHPLNWCHPEHTVEFTVDEIVTLLDMAGFEDVRVRGIWFCYDYEGHRLLPMDPKASPPEWTWQRRLAASEDRPEDCFIWWAEARRGDRPPDLARLREVATEVYERVFRISFYRFSHSVGALSGTGRDRVCRTEQGVAGYLLQGPVMPVRPGRHQVNFAVGCERSPGLGEDAEVCTLDVHCQPENRVIVSRPVKLSELPQEGMTEIVLRFDLSETAFGVQFRVHSPGLVALWTRYQADLTERRPPPAATQVLAAA